MMRNLMHEAIAEVESLASEVREVAARSMKWETRAVEDTRADLPSPPEGARQARPPHRQHP